MISKETISSHPYKKDREVYDAKKMLAGVALSTFIAFAAIGKLNEELSKNENTTRPIPTEFIPKPVNIDPLTPVEEIPLQAEGSISVNYNKNGGYALLEVKNATVVAIKKDEAGDITKFAVTVAGDKLSKNCSSENNKLTCSFSGATLWISFGEHTAIINTPKNQGADTSTEILRDNLKLGNIVSSIGIGPGYVEGSSTFSGNEVVAQNLISLNNLDKKVGEPFLRSDDSASFIAGNIVF